ncbi:MAG TPA: hypothetical protein VF463_03755 [Sphingobium sp.]
MKPAIIAIGSGLAGAAIAIALVFALPTLSGPDRDDDMATANAAAPAAANGVVTLNKSAQDHAGIHIVTLTSTRAGTVRNGLARALDIGALSAISGEIASARAALDASQADYARQRALAAEDQSASTRAVEAARAQAMADQARLDLAVRRVGLEFGPGLSSFSASAIGDLVRAVAAGQASLVRIDFSDGSAPRGAMVRIGDARESTTVRLLGGAAAADARLQSAGQLAIVRGPLARSLGAGRVLPASMATTQGIEAGTLVPRNAILRFQGGLWVYRVDVRGGFARVELLDARPQNDGWFARTGVKPGDRVAADGIGVLLSIERGGSAAAEDE